MVPINCNKLRVKSLYYIIFYHVIIKDDIQYERKKTFAEAENCTKFLYLKVLMSILFVDKMLKEIEINSQKLTKNFAIYSALETLKITPKVSKISSIFY